MTAFRLGAIEARGDVVVSLVVEGRHLDLRAVLEETGADLGNSGVPLRSEPSALLRLLDDWDALFESARNAAAAVELSKDLADRTRVRGRVVAPLLYPRAVFCAAANYTDHMIEMGSEPIDKAKTQPYFFLKLPTTCTAGPFDDIDLPHHSEQVDWECELAVVIGKHCKRVSAEHALDQVAGYCVMNDLSARDRSRRADWPVFKMDWVSAKSWDQSSPVGPYIVPAQFVDDPHNLDITLDVNGEMHQKGNTRDMVFRIEEQIAYLSNFVTLQPGDVIATGTPAGVGRTKNIYLKSGDVVTATIEGVGSIRNRMTGTTEQSP